MSDETGAALPLKRVHHIAIIASDYERSKRFYTSVLGCELLTEVYRAERDSWMGDLALNGEYLIELFSFPDPPARASGPEALGLRHLAFAVDDVDAGHARLVELGVRVEDVRIDPHTSRKMLFFFDPDGLPLELYEA
ncbi:VOC family protein [Plantibacter sp. MCCC 1A11337]|jgi:glyoxylase I family protein|uniref:VOC family protein n=1 Tax=Plantibacter TaxID=190323 RepID=UPI0008DE41A9|nr:MULTISPECIES: VOC family protein [Plantibacter]AQX80302.1 VOC family protein [Plantibacter flavus]NUJ86578.1 VOC family protein [Plantibacter sp. MCCC 1A11337]OII42364.1 lyase [Plantibacter sp. MMLR14_011]